MEVHLTLIGLYTSSKGGFTSSSPIHLILTQGGGAPHPHSGGGAPHPHSGGGAPHPHSGGGAPHSHSGGGAPHSHSGEGAPPPNLRVHLSLTQGCGHHPHPRVILFAEV